MMHVLLEEKATKQKNFMLIDNTKKTRKILKQKYQRQVVVNKKIKIR